MFTVASALSRTISTEVLPASSEPTTSARKPTISVQPVTFTPKPVASYDRMGGLSSKNKASKKAKKQSKELGQPLSTNGANSPAKPTETTTDSIKVAPTSGDTRDALVTKTTLTAAKPMMASVESIGDSGDSEESSNASIAADDSQGEVKTSVVTSTEPSKVSDVTTSKMAGATSESKNDIVRDQTQNNRTESSNSDMSRPTPRSVSVPPKPPRTPPNLDKISPAPTILTIQPVRVSTTTLQTKTVIAPDKVSAEPGTEPSKSEHVTSSSVTSSQKITTQSEPVKSVTHPEDSASKPIMSSTINRPATVPAKSSTKPDTVTPRSSVSPVAPVVSGHVRSTDTSVAAPKAIVTSSAPITGSYAASRTHRYGTSSSHGTSTVGPAKSLTTGASKSQSSTGYGLFSSGSLTSPKGSYTYTRTTSSSIPSCTGTVITLAPSGTTYSSGSYGSGSTSARLAFMSSKPAVSETIVTTRSIQSSDNTKNVSGSGAVSVKPVVFTPKPVTFAPKLPTVPRSMSDSRSSGTFYGPKDVTDSGKPEQVQTPVRSTIPQNGPIAVSSDIDNLTTCGSCFKQLNKPKMLPCVHSFCLGCLQTLIKPQAKTLECPTCKEQILVPKNGVDGFRDNRFLMQMSVKPKVSVSAPRWCDICQVPQRACQMQCVDCQEPMCQICASAHLRMKATKRHRVVKLSDDEKKTLSETQASLMQCNQHHIPVTMFCTKCDIAVCDNCVSEHHGDHRAMDLIQAAAEKRMVLQVTMSAICQKAAQLQSLMSAIDAIKSKVETHQQLQMMAIDDKKKDLVFAVERTARIFAENVGRKMGESLASISGHHDKCQIQLNLFQMVINFGNKLLEQGAPHDLVLIEKDLVNRLKTLDERLKSLQSRPLAEHVENSMFVFLPGISGDNELKSYFGNLTFDSASLQEIQQLGDNYEHERRKAESGAVQKVQLHKVTDPWIPYFHQDIRINPTSSPILQAKQMDDLCMRALTKALNKLTTKNLSTQVLHILDCQIDTEPKLERFCDKIVMQASGHPGLVPTLALLCRTLTFISVPNEKRPTTRSGVLNFLDRLCLKHFETSPGEFLATGTTPQITRSNSLSAVPLTRRSGSRSSLYDFRTLPAHGQRTPTGSRASMTDLFERNRTMYGSWGGPKKGPAPAPPSNRSRNPSGSSNVSTMRSMSGTEGADRWEEASRRRRNLCILSFLCEMYKLKMVAENIVHEWLQRLSRVENDLAIEGICAILLKVGKYLDHDRSKPIVDKVFVQLTYVSGSHTLSGRLRCMTRHVIRLRRDNWQTQTEPDYWRNLGVGLV